MMTMMMMISDVVLLFLIVVAVIGGALENRFASNMSESHTLFHFSFSSHLETFNGTLLVNQP